jgi:Cof subfamily protein (haloacid dehalogenase superfamily)
MSYKLVALDLDGTLLHDDLHIPQENIDTIQRLHRKGIEFVFVTGRPDPMTMQYVEALGIPVMVIANNGASLRRNESKEILYAKYIEEQPLAKALQILRKNNVYFRIYSLDAVASFNEDEFDVTKNKYAHISTRIAQHMQFDIIKSVNDIEFDVIKMFCLFDEPAELALVLEELSGLSGLSAIQGSALSLDIMAEGVSKGNALMRYAAAKDITMQRIIAIGDNYNDLSMLQVAGMPVAMQNAEAVAKNVAQMITASNNEAGVAKALQKLIPS